MAAPLRSPPRHSGRGTTDAGSRSAFRFCFADFWHDLTGAYPAWLYFDSKLVPYAQLAELNQRGIGFVTIRKRGSAWLRHLQTVPASQWAKAVIDIPKRRHQSIR